jgi:hypothetical protein
MDFIIKALNGQYIKWYGLNIQLILCFDVATTSDFNEPGTQQTHKVLCLNHPIWF